MASPSRDKPPSSLPVSPKAQRRFIVPTRRFLRLTLALLFLGLLVSVWPGLGVFWVLLALLLLLLFLLDTLLGAKGGEIQIERQIPLGHLGRLGTYNISLHNTGDRPLRLCLHEILPLGCEGDPLKQRLLLLPRQKVFLERSYLGTKRGNHHLPPIGLRIETLLGLAAYQEMHAKEDSLTVQPGRPSVETSWLLIRAGELTRDMDRSLLRRGGNWQFDSLREYCVGDEPRKIDWKASARRHRPMIRTYKSERNTQVLFLLDTGRLMGSLMNGINKLDRSMTPLLDLAAVCLNEGEKVGLMAFDSQPYLWVPPKDRISHLRRMIQALTFLETSHAPTSYFAALSELQARTKKRSLIILFSDFLDEISVRECFTSLAQLAKKHIVLFVAVNDPHMQKIMKEEAGDTASLMEKAVTGQLLEERRRVLAEIERLNIFTLDMDPKHLTGPLIRKYLEIRSKRV